MNLTGLISISHSLMKLSISPATPLSQAGCNADTRQQAAPADEVVQSARAQMPATSGGGCDDRPDVAAGPLREAKKNNNKATTKRKAEGRGGERGA